MALIISDYHAEFAQEGMWPFFFLQHSSSSLVASDCHYVTIQLSLSCLPCEETVDPKKRIRSLRAKEKMSNAKCLALLSGWVFFLFDRAANRLFSNAEVDHLPGVKKNVSFGCSGFSQCNKSQPQDPSFNWFNKDVKERKSFPCFYWEPLVVCVCFLWALNFLWPSHITRHFRHFWVHWCLSTPPAHSPVWPGVLCPFPPGSPAPPLSMSASLFTLTTHLAIWPYLPVCNSHIISWNDLATVCWSPHSCGWWVLLTPTLPILPHSSFILLRPPLGIPTRWEASDNVDSAAK